MGSKKYFLLLSIILPIMLSLVVAAQGDLVVELGEPELLPKDGYSESVFLPYKIRNIGDEPITSRFPIKMLQSGAREGIGYPLYLYSGEMKTVGVEPLHKAFIEKADGTTYWQEIGTTSIQFDNGIIPAAPAVTLQPGEALLFTDKDVVGALNTFSFQNSGVYTIGYEVDPPTNTNEIKEKNDDNNAASLEYNITVKNYIKGPNEYLAANEYWFYFNEINDCVSLDLPNPTEICLIDWNSFTSTISVDGTEIKLWHFFELWGYSKKHNNLEFVSADGFKVTYT
ncbi:hypothetical protein HYT55_00780 [Candidatus Woesearchaeota archaeon]|nr:hypothetical protein [Candidatus Woesearchaeota archaeon]